LYYFNIGNDHSLFLQCQAGSYCIAGSISASSTLCPPGTYCPSGSAAGLLCPSGKYSTNGASQCSLCDAGRYGVGSDTASTCSGACAEGFYCPAGAVNSTAIPCPRGSYCPAGSSGPLDCPGGVYGATVGLTSAQCSGGCPPGYHCPGKTADPIPCGNETVYCPAGYRSPQPVQQGYYSTPAVGGNGSANMVAVVECPPGAYCANGVLVVCPPGTYQGSFRKGTLSDCRVCSDGGYCPEGSLAPIPCGNDTVYCPRGSVSPLPCTPGYYTDGFSSSQKSELVLCPRGSYCPGDGLRYPCGKGYYGAAMGLLSPSCSGRCDDGALCPLESVASSGTACPMGYFCVAGLGTACPPGTYNDALGAATRDACVLCPENTFSPVSNSTSIAGCQACNPFEGSNPGASACWPGVIGVLCELWLECSGWEWVRDCSRHHVRPHVQSLLPVFSLLRNSVTSHKSRQRWWRRTLSPFSRDCPLTIS
jgi:hypothetical protein